MWLPRPRPWWAAPPVIVAVIALALEAAVAPRHAALDALPDVLRVIAAAVVLFGLTGFGAVRLLLPASLARHELLWILPAGACVSGLALMALAFAGLPFTANLSAVLVGGAVMTVFAWRRRPGLPARAGQGWPVLLAVMIAGLALIPMVMQMHIATVTGDGADAHLAAGTANLLQHVYPTGTDERLPTDTMPLLWKSKYPIYYAFAGVASVAGLETWQTLTPLAAVLLALAATGMFLFARESLGASTGVAALAMAFVGFDRMVLHTGMHPYFNQTWGYLAMPFALVLAWTLVRSGEPAPDRRRSAALLALFVIVLALAYPLALPFVGLPLLVFLWRERRRRIAEGRPVPRLRALYRGPWSLLYLVPVAAVLLVPLKGVNEKLVSATTLVLDRGVDLGDWAGDRLAFTPTAHFFNLPEHLIGILAVGVIVGLALFELRRQPRTLYLGLGLVLLLFLWQAVSFRQRDFGYYIHFKILAFTAPLLLVLATVSLGRRRRWGPVVLAAFAAATTVAARAELRATGLQLGTPTITLADWAQELPRDASVRLDMAGGRQLWAAYFLAARRTCSREPLIEADYPHVARSTKADYVLVHRDAERPPEAIGAPLQANDGYELYQLSPLLPGADRCSYRQRSPVRPEQIPG